MKHIYFSALLLMLSTIGYSQTVAEQQTALVVKKTATWCTPCGTWGWDLFSEIWDEVGEESVILEMHNSSSSGLYSSDANAFYSLHEPRSSTPVFYVNTINEVEYASSGGIYPGLTKSNVISAVNTTNAMSPVVNSGFTHSITGTNLSIDTKVKFFENTSGEYYLGVYVTEDNVQANQSGISGVATHKRIMRASVHPNIEGTLITSGSISAGDEFSETYSFDLDAGWNTDYIKVFTVIWKKNGSNFEYENAYQTNGFLSTENNSKADLNVKLYPNTAEGDQAVNLVVAGAANKEMNINVYTQVGQKVSSIYDGEIIGEDMKFDVNPTKSLSRGLYFVNITSKNHNTQTLKLVIK